MMSEDTRRVVLTVEQIDETYDTQGQLAFYKLMAKVQGLLPVDSKFAIPVRVHQSQLEGEIPAKGSVYDVILKKGNPKKSLDPEDPSPADWHWYWNVDTWAPGPVADAPTTTGSPVINRASAPAQSKPLSHTEAKALDEWHKDRRTALMYSVEYMKIEAKDAGHEQNLAEIREGFWRWLRQEDGSVMPEEEGA